MIIELVRAIFSERGCQPYINDRPRPESNHLFYEGSLALNKQPRDVVGEAVSEGA
jgi:hypothetical protein